MVAKTKLVSDEFDILCNRTQRKCVKSTLTRLLAISAIVLIVLMFSIIYHGIVLERMDKLRQILALNAKHQHNKNPTDAELKLSASIQLMPDTEADAIDLAEYEEAAAADEDGNTAIDSNDNNAAQSLRVQHLQMKYFRRRLPRDLTDLLDPMNVPSPESSPDFEGLYAKVRNKRTKIALSKLEKEYVRCKKESMNGNDCMVAFVKMYSIAKDISEKMEKMKAIFKDSEVVLLNSSGSHSKESKELHKDVTTTLKGNNAAKYQPAESDVKSIDINVMANVSTTTTKMPEITLEVLTTALETTTLKFVKPEKHVPMKISWIIDGNDDYGMEDEKTTTSTTTTTTTTTTTSTTEAPTTSTTEATTTSTTEATRTSTTEAFITSTSNTTEILTTVTAIEFPSISSTTTTEASTTEVWIEFSSLSSDKAVTPSTEGSTTDKSFKSSSDKFSLILDSITSDGIATNTVEPLETTKRLDKVDFSSTTTPTQIVVTTEDSTQDVLKELETVTDGNEDVELLRKLKFDWIIDGDEDEEIAPEVADRTNISKTSTTTTTLSPIHFTTTAVPTKTNPIKFTWIIDSDANGTENTTRTVASKERVEEMSKSNPALFKTLSISNSSEVTITYGGNCTKTLNSNNEMTSSCNVGYLTSSLNTTKSRSNDEVHPLDYPSSLENMLESFERHEGMKPIILELKEHATNDTSTTSPYDRNEWEKKFQETAVVRPQEELIDSFGDIDAKSMSKFGPKLNPANANGFGSADSEFLTLCERMAKRVRNKGASSGNSASQSESETFTQSPNVQFTSRGPGNFPVTGESMKSSAQFMFNPNFGIPSIPICFYITPASFRINQVPMWSQNYGGMSNSFGSSGNGQMGNRGGNSGGFFFLPQNFGTGNFMGGHVTGTGGGSSGNQANIPNIYPKNALPQKQQQQQQKQQFYCTYMQNQANSNMVNQGGSVTGNGATGVSYSNTNFKMRTAANQTLSTDIIYASYSGLPDHLGQKDHFKCALEEQVACYGGNECIRENSWCDGTVDCSDGSDEAACTCRDRLIGLRICDGYADCPMAEDEIGCFGCGGSMYSCYDTSEEYERFNRSMVSMCYSAMEKCDGFINCLNGKDELECSIIVADISHHMSHSVSTSEGYLYHNHRGEWYPVCNNAAKWAKEACESEGGYFGTPNITFQPLTLSGPFIEPSVIGNAHFPQSCQKRDSHDLLTDHVSYVRCAPAKCGIVKRNKVAALRPKSRRIAEHLQKDDGVNERIVGGIYSRPLQWPFVVSVYRNGNFHCGGTIYSESWVISAAHCAINFQNYHYEVRAGVLRRSSYSISTQIQPVSHIVVHQAYERRSMRNDLSLLRLAEPLKFNRWIKPICLPDVGRTTLDDNWIWGPEANTMCTAVGWGAVREKGPGSDQLREVTLPIRKNCTEKEDREAEDICAGDTDGGRDACQGDSGGPLFCRSAANSAEWYLAGVVSHGNGCARPGEFGVYTRVALYLDWLEMAVRPEFLPQKQPLQLCTGFICVWGGKRCIAQRKRCDRVVHCLGGEDEVGCVYNFIPDVSSSRNITTTTESDYFPVKELSTTPADILGYERIMLEGNAKQKEELNKRETTSATEVPQHQEHVNFESFEDATEGDNDLVEMNTKSDTSSELPTDMPTTTSESFFDDSEEVTTTWKLPIETTTVTESTSTQIPPTTMFPTSMDELNKLRELAEKVLQQTTTTEKEFITDSTTTLSTEGPQTTTTLITTTTTELNNGFTTLLPTMETDDNFTTLLPTESTTISQTTDTTTTMPSTTDNNFGVFNSNVDTIAKSKVNTFVRKRENATESTEIPKIPKKFVCQKMLQIIDLKHRCDRFVDCEDGTDEVGCNCRDYLKGPLNILICDGKTDCVDLTDEDDCGNCTSEEFLCPLSKNCVPLTKRCDNVVDCKFKEDEKDCFALTNGREIFLDSNKQPALSSVGVFSRNMHGVWRVVCSHETAFHTHGAKTAGEVCALLGFSGFYFYNTTEFITSADHIFPIDPDIAKKPRLQQQLSPVVGDNLHFTSAENKFPITIKSKERIMRIEMNTKEKCMGLYLECHARTNKTEPLKTLSAGVEIKSKALNLSKLEPALKIKSRPNVAVKPHMPIVMVKKKEEIMDKLNEVIESKKNASVLVHDKLHEAMEELHWPWLADIYKNGKLWCVGVLVDKYWVLVHESCYFGTRFESYYVTALLGGGKTKNLHHKSPTEQIRRIDCFDMVPNSDVLLYHLEQPVHFTHHVLPTFLPDLNHYNETAQHECISVLHDEQYGRIKTVSIVEQKDDHLCRHSDMSCFRLLENKPSATLMAQTEISAEDLASISEEVALKGDDAANRTETPSLSKYTTCTQFGSKNASDGISDPIDQGILVCRNIDSGWYPAALFAYNNTNCSSFKENFGIRTLEKVYPTVQNIIDQPKCTFTHAAPACNTFRCRLGVCLESSQVCDGQSDCHDGSDEEADMCREHKKECKPSEMQCRTSRKCIPKTKFCDHVVDCEDHTDEPTICSCYTYLKATDPARICDGVRNCWDKSDESPVFCNCTADRFPCGPRAQECIPRDFVCDKEPDCPNGEDEKYCYGIEHPIQQPVQNNDFRKPQPHDYHRPMQYGQVIEQNYGVWHTKCFPRQSPPDVSEVRQICKKLGYNPFRSPSYRLIDDAANVVVETNEKPDRGRSVFSNDSLVGKYRDSTKAVIVSKFSPLHLNDELTLFLKPSRPIAELVRWNATDSSQCYRLEIKCA